MAKYKDNDILNMAGDWQLTISTVIQTQVVAGVGSNVYDLRFHHVEPGTHGGTRFKGQYVIRPEWGDFYHGETFYDHRGLQVVQLIGYLKAEQYYELLVGNHQPGDPRAPRIFGSWCGTGVSSDAPNQGSNTMGMFELVKLRT